MRIYVTGIPQTWTSTQLDALFRPYGKIDFAEIRVEKHDHAEKYGVIKFHLNDSAEEALIRLNGAKVHGHVLTVTNTCPLPTKHT